MRLSVYVCVCVCVCVCECVLTMAWRITCWTCDDHSLPSLKEFRVHLRVCVCASATLLCRLMCNVLFLGLYIDLCNAVVIIYTSYTQEQFFLKLEIYNKERFII